MVQLLLHVTDELMGHTLLVGGKLKDGERCNYKINRHVVNDRERYDMKIKNQWRRIIRLKILQSMTQSE